jgi:hypothetical protein
VTGLDYMRAREYDPTTEQFLSIDPAVDSTRQPYAYAGNNPLLSVDPTGLDAESDAELYHRPYVLLDLMLGLIPGYTLTAHLCSGDDLYTAMVKTYNPMYSVIEGGTNLSNDIQHGSSGFQVAMDTLELASGVAGTAGIAFGGAGIAGSLGRGGSAARSVSRGVDAVGGSRGLNSLGGIVSEGSTNSVGGRIITSTGTITQKDFATFVHTGVMKGENVEILTGVHGEPNGSIIPDSTLFADDVNTFGGLPGVTVHNVAQMLPEQIRAVMRGPGTIIGGFCSSAVCLAPYQ